MARHDETLATEQAGTRGAAPGHRYLAVFELGSSRVVPLPDSGALVVGRGDEAGLRVSDAKVSRAHVRFAITPDAVSVVDLESQNGTFVNGEPNAAPRALVSGDVIEIGRTSLVFHAAPRERRGSAQGIERFRAWLAEEIERAELSERPLALASLIAGDTDAMERAFALLRAEAVGVERLAHDGHRLAILLPETPPNDALARAHQLVARLAGAKMEARAGLALHPADGCDPDALLTSARASAAEARVGEVRVASATFRTLDVGNAPLIVADAAMQRLYALVERLAASDLPVLIQGETGAGKELAARALHYWSRRRDGRLVAVNCAALHEALAESELFGHERGAFTGATASKPGLLETASGGTVFFDEIGDLPPPVQVKLLRALDTGRVTRLGDVDERPIDVRIVAATHKHLEQEVAQGRFRQDLYFRLSGATLWLPPLRDRPRELALLARRFLDEARARLGRRPMRLSDDATRLLAAHAWPGNVRELRNVMEFAAAAFDDAVLEPWQLAARLGGSAPAEPPPAAAGAPGAPQAPAFRPLEDEIRELECARMQQALHAAGGNQKRAAQLIAMPLRTFVSKLTRYGLRRP